MEHLRWTHARKFGVYPGSLLGRHRSAHPRQANTSGHPAGVTLGCRVIAPASCLHSWLDFLRLLITLPLTQGEPVLKCPR